MDFSPLAFDVVSSSTFLGLSVFVLLTATVVSTCKNGALSSLPPHIYTTITSTTHLTSSESSPGFEKGRRIIFSGLATLGVAVSLEKVPGELEVSGNSTDWKVL